MVTDPILRVFYFIFLTAVFAPSTSVPRDPGGPTSRSWGLTTRASSAGCSGTRPRPSTRPCSPTTCDRALSICCRSDSSQLAIHHTTAAGSNSTAWEETKAKLGCIMGGQVGGGVEDSVWLIASVGTKGRTVLTPCPIEGRRSRKHRG